MTQGRSTKVISMIEWVRTSRLSIISLWQVGPEGAEKLAAMLHDNRTIERLNLTKGGCQATWKREFKMP